MDNILIEKVIEGDRKSIENFYKECKLNIKTYLVYNYKGNRDIEDDTSEIIIKVYQNLKKYKPTKGKFDAWIKSIAKNYMIDKHRSLGDYKTISLNDFVMCNDATSSYIITRNSADNKNIYLEIPSEDPNQEENLENQDIVFSLTSTISNYDNNLLNMKYVEGYSYDEIATEHRLSSTTVSNKVNYIKTKLKNGSKG